MLTLCNDLKFHSNWSDGGWEGMKVEFTTLVVIRQNQKKRRRTPAL